MAEPIVKAFGRDSIIVDAAYAADARPAWFDADDWRGRGALPLVTTRGRGTVLKLDRSGDTWVLRHYQRGGLVARLVLDHYVWLGRERTRAFREFRLLLALHAEGFPVPRPIAARVVRGGLLYRADIITQLLAGTRTLSSYLTETGPVPGTWSEIGRMLRRLHDRGVDHPDLTAHNLLVDVEGRVFLVDFDNTRIRPPGKWRQAGVERLQRSLRKVALESGTEFDPAGWDELLHGYGR